MSTPSPSEIAEMMASCMPRINRDMVLGFIPEMRKAGFFDDQSDEDILALPFPVVMAYWNASAWASLFPTPTPATTPAIPQTPQEHGS